jgi:hypothetical protein
MLQTRLTTVAIGASSDLEDLDHIRSVQRFLEQLSPATRCLVAHDNLTRLQHLPSEGCFGIIHIAG